MYMVDQEMDRLDKEMSKSFGGEPGSSQDVLGDDFKHRIELIGVLSQITHNRDMSDNQNNILP